MIKKLQNNLWLTFMKCMIFHYMHDAQLAIIITMIKKWFRGFGYIFLVVSSLDFMLRVKSSQKLSVPSVPNFKNVDFYSERLIFSAIFDIST